MFDPISLILIALLGLAAGTLGGMLGVGGSILMIPGLTVLFGSDQHLYQAAAMAVNVAVAVPAAMRHHRAKAVRLEVLKVMLPMAVACIVLGVWVSNRSVFAGEDGAVWLGRVLGVFLVYVVGLNLYKLRARAKDEDAADARVTLTRSGAVGGSMGFVAGLLGIGGGAVAVPLQQVWLKLPLRQAIANSSTVMCVSAAVGAVLKNATLAPHGHTLAQSLTIAGLLAPTAILGARLGATLTHRLPLRQVRIALILLLTAAAWKMLAIPGSPI